MLRQEDLLGHVASEVSRRIEEKICIQVMLRDGMQHGTGACRIMKVHVSFEGKFLQIVNRLNLVLQEMNEAPQRREWLSIVYF